MQEEKKEKQEVSKHDQELYALLLEELPELYELNDDLEAFISMMIMSGGKVEFEQIGDVFTRYASTLASFQIFNKLSNSLATIKHLIDAEAIRDQEANGNEILLLLESFIFKSRKWLDEWQVVDLKAISDTSFDLIGDLEMIRNLWLREEDEEDFILF
jgi:hypothetical protein